jgi:uncharacterized membrane protein
MLNVLTYLDMLQRGRSASELPGRTVRAGLARLGVDLEGGREARGNRETALGALAGIASGLGVGVATSVVRQSGLRLSPATGSGATAAVARAVADLPAAALGVTDPNKWSAADWAGDAVPHLAFGLATHETVRALERRNPAMLPARPASPGLVTRSFLLGVAAGCRSSLGLTAIAFGGSGESSLASAGRAGTLLAVASELVADKQPGIPSRLSPEGLVPRLASGAVGATALAAHERAVVDLPVAAGLAGVVGGAIGGAAFREAVSGRLRSWQSGLLEDAVAVLLAAAAVRRG